MAAGLGLWPSDSFKIRLKNGFLLIIALLYSTSSLTFAFKSSLTQGLECHGRDQTCSRPLSPNILPVSKQDSGSSENPSESQSLTSLTTNDDDKDETDCAKKLFIELRPKCLDFGRRPVGITHQETISISINLKYAAANRKPVKLLYLSSSIHDFQFDNSSRTIYPRENNSIQIIFHPRQFGKRDETIYFHFSIGNPILLNVTGIGIANPFKLPLFFAAKLPLNASYSPLIKVFNPYDTTLQISEVFSSSGEIHLEFPTETAAAKHPWVIPAHQTHTISRLAFLGAIENNYTAYLCIHTNASLTNSSIIVPIQIEVTTAPGLFSITNLFDFGIIEGSGIIKSIDIYLLHIGKKQTQIADISVVPSHEAVSVKFNSKVKLKSDGIYRKVGTILLDSDKISNEEFLTGVIKIKSNNRHAYKLDIPYCATIHKGWLKFSKNSVTIQIKTGTTSVIIRPLTLENHFRTPLSVSKIKLDKGKALVKISQFSKFDVLPVGKIVTLFQFNINCSKYKSPVSTSLTLYTNLTSFRVPIQIFDGSLKFYRNKIGVSSLNFDTVATNDIRLVSLLVKNINPINITILKIRSSLDCISIFPQNDAKLATLQNPLIMVPELEINFTIRLESPDTAGLYIGQIEFITDHEELQLPWKFKSVNVNIRPGLDPIVFSPSFPSRREIQTLWMTSNYHPFTKIKSIQYDPSDIRFEFSFANESSSSLKGDESTLVGYLSFIPSKDIQYRYIGLNQPELDNAAWIKSLQLDQETTAVDTRFYNKLQEKWKYLEDNGLTSSVHQLKIETDIIENINVTVQASLMWPSIITTEGPIIYPLTHPKNYSSKVVALVNPSDQNIIVQAVLLPDYPSQQAALDIIEDGVVIDTDSQSLNGFKLQMAAHSDYESISTIDGIKSHPASLSFLLKPRGRANITVSFTPSDYRVSSTFLLIRNNLTIIDSILLQGQGGRGELQLHGDNISCNGSLQFVAHPSDLLHCSDKKSSHFNTASKFEILSKFIMENSGKLPIFVKKMDINGFECSGYGFEIKNCTSFLLNPKHNIQIDIGFEPDFSISVIERTLRIHTSDDGIREFNLIAILPHYLLPNCSSLRITPSWINWTSKIAWLIMTGILIFIVGLAMSKSKNISRQILPLICDDKANGNVAHYSPSTDVFDLKALINTKQLFENAENLLDDDEEGSERSNNSIIDEIDADMSSHDSGITDAYGEDNEDKMFGDETSNDNAKNDVPWRMHYTSNDNEEKNTALRKDSVGEIDNADVWKTSNSKLDKEINCETSDQLVQITRAKSRHDLDSSLVTAATAQSSLPEATDSKKYLDKADNKADQQCGTNKIPWNTSSVVAHTTQEHKTQKSKLLKKNKKSAVKKDASHQQKGKNDHSIEAMGKQETTISTAIESSSKINKDRQKSLQQPFSTAKDTDNSKAIQAVAESPSSSSSHPIGSNPNVDKSASTHFNKDIDNPPNKANTKKSKMTTQHQSKPVYNNKANINKSINIEKQSVNRDGKQTKKGPASHADPSNSVLTNKKMSQELKQKHANTNIQESSISPSNNMQSKAITTASSSSFNNSTESYAQSFSRERHDDSSNRKSDITHNEFYLSSVGNLGSTSPDDARHAGNDGHRYNNDNVGISGKSISYRPSSIPSRHSAFTSYRPHSASPHYGSREALQKVPQNISTENQVDNYAGHWNTPLVPSFDQSSPPRLSVNENTSINNQPVNWNSINHGAPPMLSTLPHSMGASLQYYDKAIIDVQCSAAPPTTLTSRSDYEHPPQRLSAGVAIQPRSNWRSHDSHRYQNWSADAGDDYSAVSDDRYGSWPNSNRSPSYPNDVAPYVNNYQYYAPPASQHDNNWPNVNERQLQQSEEDTSSSWAASFMEDLNKDDSASSSGEKSIVDYNPLNYFGNSIWAPKDDKSLF